MIEEYSLKLLCDKYGVSKENIVNKNNNILSKGEYEDIDKTLNYLINSIFGFGKAKDSSAQEESKKNEEKEEKKPE